MRFCRCYTHPSECRVNICVDYVGSQTNPNIFVTQHLEDSFSYRYYSSRKKQIINSKFKNNLLYIYYILYSLYKKSKVSYIFLVDKK